MKTPVPPGPVTYAPPTEELAEEFMGRDVRDSGFGLLALDEFQVNDPYTAVVLKALLETLLEAGVMARSSTDCNRSVFAPFSRLMATSCDPCV